MAKVNSTTETEQLLLSLEDMVDEMTHESRKSDLSSKENSEEAGDASTVLLNEKNARSQKFDGFLIEAIDEALISLGEPVKNTVYFQLENSFGIPKNEIPKRIDDFIVIIHKIFGLGASRLELRFMKNLYAKINITVEFAHYEGPLSKWIIEDVSFIEYVQRMRENYCNCNQNSETTTRPKNGTT